MVTVQLPDGSIASFPDGTTKEEIDRVVRRDFSEMFETDSGKPQFTPPSPEDQKLLDETLPKKPSDKTFTPTTVLEDKEAMADIRKYMTTFGGLSADKSDEEIVEAFLPRMRKFAAGQSIVTMDELISLKKSDDEGLITASNAYDRFDQFSGVFSDDYTWGETFGGLGSYARAVIIDPTNLIGVGLGRVIAGSSAKAGTIAAKQIAKAAADKAMKRALVSKLKAKGAKKVLEKGATTAAEKAALGGAVQAAKLAEREVLRKSASQATVKSALKSQLLKETAIAGGLDAAMAVGVDAAYQSSMMLTGRQEEYSAAQGGLNALAGLVGAGAGYALGGGTKQLSEKASKEIRNYLNLNPPKETTGVVEAYLKSNPISAVPKASAKVVSDNSDKFIQDLGKNFTEFSKRVRTGRILTEMDDPVRGVDEQAFWKFFILGDEEKGVKGVARVLNDLGVQAPAKPRYDGDNITSFIADTLTELPENVKETFVDIFRKEVGTHLPDYKNAGMKEIANLLSYQTSVSGQQLNILFQAKKILGSELNEYDLLSNVSARDFMDSLNPATLFEKAKGEGKSITEQAKRIYAQAKLDEKAGKITKDDLKRIKLQQKQIIDAAKERPDRIGFFQSNLIQTIVSHPGTTILNIKGGGFRVIMDTTSDLVQGALYTGIGTAGFLRGNREFLNKGIQTIKGSGERIPQLVRASATKAEVEDYLALRPEIEQKLFRFISGGVESGDMLKAFNMDKAGPIAKGGAKAVEGYKQFAQKLYLVQAQDRVFKNMNFMYNLNKNIRKKYGMSYSEFMKRPDATTIMNSLEYSDIEFRAVDDTLKSVFGKSYGEAGASSSESLNFAAKFIEDFRKRPIIGAMMPFGQFFNNTVDMMADYSMVKFIYRMNPMLEEKMTWESGTEAFAKGAVGLSLMYGMAFREMSAIEDGLGLFEERNADGSVENKEYDFPESFFKAMGRLIAYKMLDREIPEELLSYDGPLVGTFGPDALTRTVGQGFGSVRDAFGTLFDEGLVEGAAALAKVGAEKVGSAWLSGYTRPIDPINQLAGIVREEGTLQLDRKQGYRWINDSARYIDQFVGGVLMDLGAEKKESAYSEYPATDIGKLVGHRTVPQQSYTQRMMNGIEMPYWKAGFAGGTSTGNAKLDNRLNALVFDKIERKAARLLLGTNWETMSTAGRRKAVSTLWEEARKEARRSLLAGVGKEDMKLFMMDKVLNASGSDKDLKKAMEELGFDKELHEYDAFQIEAIFQQLKRTQREVEMEPFK